MNTEVLLYWITRLDSIRLVIAIGVAAAVIAAVIGVAFIVLGHADGFGPEREDIKRGYKILKKSILPLVLALALRVFVPSTQEALIIIGVGGTIDYLKSNETTTQLPDKVIKALDKFVDGFLDREPADEKPASYEH